MEVCRYMVKGVNKQIIEVNNPDSIYFERAVFYLRAGVRSLPSEISQREIERFIAGTGYKKRRKLFAGKMIILAALVIVTAVIIITLI